MSVTKKQMESNKRYDMKHFKYHSVKMKISEYEALKKAVEISGETTNGFMRKAIMNRVNEFIPESGRQDDEQNEPL